MNLHFRCCRNGPNILSNNEPQFRSSIYDSSIATNHYTFGRTSYYVTHPSDGGPNVPHLQQNVNMTLNYDRSTASTNGGFGGMIHPLPLSLSAAEATLSHHLCQTRPSQALRHQTLLMPRSCSDDINVETNAWGTQQKHNKREPKIFGYPNKGGLVNEKEYPHNKTSQMESLYQELDTCRYDPQSQQGFDSSFNNIIKGNVSARSSDSQFLLGLENGILLSKHTNRNQETNPYSVPSEHHMKQPPINALHTNRQTCFHPQNGNESFENHYQNLKKGNTCSTGLNGYSSNSINKHRPIQKDLENDNVCDIWQKDTRDRHEESPR